MATFKDIAKLAGVSYGTVSNVLNGKSNVSAAKIHKVEEAAKQLGYVTNTQAKDLRKGRSNRIYVITPDFSEERYHELMEGVAESARAAGKELFCISSDNDPMEEKAILDKLVPMKPLAVILASCTPGGPPCRPDSIPLYLAFRTAQERKEPFSYFGFDFFAAGKALAEEAWNQNCRSFALFRGDTRFSDEKAFGDGIASALTARSASWESFSFSTGREIRGAFPLCATRHFDAIFASSVQAARALREALYYQDKGEGNHTRIFFLSGKSTSFPEGTRDQDMRPFRLNYRLCGKRIVERILSGASTTTRTIIPSDGFAPALQKREAQRREKSIRFLTLKSPTTEALKLILPSFTRETGISVIIDDYDARTLNRKLLEGKQECGDTDIIRLDMAYLPDVGPLVLRPLDFLSEPFLSVFKTLDKPLPDEFLSVNGTPYTLPLDISVQMLFYRKDLFENVLIKRQFKEMTGYDLKPPATYEAFDRISQFFTRSCNPNSPTEFGTVCSCSSPQICGCDILPRLDALGWVPTGGTTFGDEALLQKGMSDYLASFTISAKNTNGWWDIAMQDFIDGKVAMVSVYSNYASYLVTLDASAVNGRIGFARLPGKKPLLGGGIVGIGKGCAHLKETLTFLSWLYSPRIASLVTSLGGFIDSTCVYENTELPHAYPWLESLRSYLKEGKRRQAGQSPRYTTHRFEQILGAAVQSIVTGKKNIPDAIKEARTEFMADCV